MRVRKRRPAVPALTVLHAVLVWCTYAVWQIAVLGYAERYGVGSSILVPYRTSSRTGWFGGVSMVRRTYGFGVLLMARRVPYCLSYQYGTELSTSKGQYATEDVRVRFSIFTSLC